jgi:plasmid stabilization system protein ParE
VGTRTRRRAARGPSRLLLYVAWTVVLAVVVAACTAGEQSGPVAPARPEPAASTTAPASRLGSAADVVPAAPGDAALLLQSLLGQHTVLAADMMRGRLRDDPDLAQAANAALGKNTDAIGQIVAALFGEQARKQFAMLWSGHVQALFNYSRGLAENDAAVRAAARTAVARFERELAGFFSTASQGRLPNDAAQSAVTMHIDHLVQQTDAYAAKRYAEADRIYREGFRHAFGLGEALASTLLPPAAAPVLTTPMWRLRSELGRLLGEHVVLVISTMRAAATNSPDFATAAATVNANTQDLAGAIDTLFGPAAAKSFQALWADHVDAIVSYSGAIRQRDGIRSADAANILARFETKLATFLGVATKDKLAASALAKSIREHDRMLLDQVDAYLGKDYQQANDIGYATYQEMYGLARELSDAFGKTAAAKLPRGGVETGGGAGAAQPRGDGG